MEKSRVLWAVSVITSTYVSQILNIDRGKEIFCIGWFTIGF